MAQLNSVNCYNQIPISEDYFDFLYTAGLATDSATLAKFKFELHQEDMQNSFFPGINENPDKKLRKFLNLFKSTKIIKDPAISIVNNYEKEEKMSLKKKLNNLRNGVYGSIVNWKSDYHEKGSAIITFGPWLTRAHFDQLGMGGIALIPSWIPATVVKLWVISTETKPFESGLLMTKFGREREEEEQREMDTKVLVDCVKSGDAFVIIQRPGQVLRFPGGHSHAVITAFKDSTAQLDNVCIMETKNEMASIEVANTMLPKYKRISYTDEEAEDVMEVYKRNYTEEQRHTFDTSKAKVTAAKSVATRELNREKKKRSIEIMNKANSKKNRVK